MVLEIHVEEGTGLLILGEGKDEMAVEIGLTGRLALRAK